MFSTPGSARAVRKLIPKERHSVPRRAVPSGQSRGRMTARTCATGGRSMISSCRIWPAPRRGHTCFGCTASTMHGFRLLPPAEISRCGLHFSPNPRTGKLRLHSASSAAIDRGVLRCLEGGLAQSLWRFGGNLLPIDPDSHARPNHTMNGVGDWFSWSPYLDATLRASDAQAADVDLARDCNSVSPPMACCEPTRTGRRNSACRSRILRRAIRT